MDLSRIRIPSPFNRRWYSQASCVVAGLVVLSYCTSMFGLHVFGELAVWLAIGGLVMLGLLGSVLLSFDGKFTWAFSYLGMVIVVVIIGLNVYASSMLAQSLSKFPL